MARIPVGVSPAEYDDLQVVARRVLLDGIEALRDHADALTVVGAQAVYLRSAEVALAVPAFTTDADFGLDPALLGDSPRIEEAVAASGFVLRDQNQPGLWAKSEIVGTEPRAIGLDLLVAEAFAGKGDRSARLPPHGKMVARRVAGLEAAVVDADVLPIESLEPGRDHRALPARVAGPAALLVAKAYKISERVAEGKAGRIVDKDAADIIRLMLAVDVEDAVERFAVLLADARVGSTAAQGLVDLRRLFAGAHSPGTDMARRALAGDRNQDRVHDIAQQYLADLPASV